MLDSGPWNRLSLTVCWLREVTRKRRADDYFCSFLCFIEGLSSAVLYRPRTTEAYCYRCRIVGPEKDPSISRNKI